MDALLDTNLIDAAHTLDHRLDRVAATHPGAHQSAGGLFGRAVLATLNNGAHEEMVQRPRSGATLDKPGCGGDHVVT
jgi:hypothetical protein